ncbi:MAG: hypothetical protein HZA21_05120 [Nitrospirae bacterium]|nr:hypothetical protein [Nitrospirota bacterium]
MRVQPLLWVAGVLLAVTVAPAWGGAGQAEKVSGRLSVRDALTVPGRSARVEARLVRSGLLGETGLGGEQLVFLVGGRTAGTAMTGGDGRAFLEHRVRMRGNHVMTVRLVPNKRVESAEASATLACWERRRPILFVDVESLVGEAKTPRIPLPSLPIEIGRQERQAPASDAADELKRLTDYYFNVIYLIRSDREETGAREEAREWLRKHRFPVGLLVTMRPGPAPLADLVERMRADGWDNLKAGVGRTREFAEALVDLRIAVVVIPSSTKDAEMPSKAQVAKDWKEVRKKLQS